MKNLFSILVFAIFTSLFHTPASATVADGINILSDSMRTVCVVGDSTVYERIKSWNSQANTLNMLHLLHDHPASPPQGPEHYYGVHEQLQSCGAFIIFMTNAGTVTQQLESFEAAMFVTRTNRKAVFIGTSKDYVLRNVWVNNLKGISHDVTVFEDLGTIQAGWPFYVNTGISPRSELRKPWLGQ